MTAEKEKAIKEFTASMTKLGSAPEPNDFMAASKYMNQLMETIETLYDNGFRHGYAERIIGNTKKDS